MGYYDNVVTTGTPYEKEREIEELIARTVRAITEEEFAQSQFFVYTPVYFGFTQLHDIDNPFLTKSGLAAINGKYFVFFDGTGFVICNDYWKKKVVYYKFGCEHQMRGLTQQEYKRNYITKFRCQHEEICDVCGYIRITDSSD